MTVQKGLLLLFRSASAFRRRELGLLLVLVLAAAVADSLAIVTLSGFLTAVTREASDLRFWPFAGAILTASALRFAVAFATQHFAQYAARDLMADIHHRVLTLPYEEHFHRHSADLLAIPSKVEQLMFGLIVPLLLAAGALVTTLCVMASLLLIDNGAAIGALVAVTALFVTVSLAARRHMARAGELLSQAYSDRIRVTQDSLGSLRDVVMGAQQPAHVAQFHVVATRTARSGLSTSMLSALPRHAGEALGIVAVAGMALFFASGKGGLAAAIPALGALALAGQRLMPMAQAFYQGWAGMVAGKPLLDDVMAYLELPRPDVTTEAAVSSAFEHSMELRDVSYRYPGATASALEQVSLRIAKGQMVALTGASGAGKSTLADVIMGLLQPQAGALLVDGVQVTDCTMPGWRRLIAHVPQSPFLFDASIADNIAVGGGHPADGHLLHQAVETAGLSQTVATLPSGLATRLGEHGVRLSGGQRQRIALARAIYRQAPVLILDEATSAVDDDSEQGIRSALASLKRSGVTIILIAHRSGLIADADLLVPLSAGRIVPPSVVIEPGVEHQDCP